jgi:hypothetical protein
VPEYFTLTEGSVNDRTLTCKVIPANGNHIRYIGIEKLVLLEDGKTMQGTIGGLPAVAGKVISFSGVWSGVLNNNFSVTLTLKQTGDTVTGGGQATFPGPYAVPEYFTLTEGSVNDRTLTCKVIPANGNHIRYIGIEKLVLLEDGKTMQGTLGGLPAVAGYAGQLDSGGKVEPVSFNGTWNAVTDDGVQWVFNIQNAVPGKKPMGDFYRVNDSATRISLHFAYILDRSLHCDAQINHKYVDKGCNLLLSADGKSFKGTCGKNTITGTLVK